LKKSFKPTQCSDLCEIGCIEKSNNLIEKRQGSARQDRWRFYATVSIHPRAPRKKERQIIILSSLRVHMTLRCVPIILSVVKNAGDRRRNSRSMHDDERNRKVISFKIVRRIV